MKLLWIGELLSPTLEKKVIHNDGAIMSALISERNLVTGIDSLGIEMDSINSCQVSVTCKVPRNKMPIIEREQWSRNSSSTDISVSYKNIKYLDMILRTKALKKETRQWANENKNQDTVSVIVYNMHSPYLEAAIEIKKIIPSAKIFLIVTDLPMYMDLEMSLIKKILKFLDWQNMKNILFKKIDRYILYAEPMAKYLELNREEWLLMEGSYDPDIIPQVKEECTDKVIVMYSGALHNSFGIEELLKAMDLLDDRYELWLTGKGTAVSLINEKAQINKKIRYLGFLPSRRELLEAQAKSTMLINMRKKEEAASEYCFPSKLFEYMVSGRPVLSCRLGGIPNEYYDYLIELPEIQAKSIAQTIEKVGNMSIEERRIIGISGREFILNKKNKYNQSRMMINFVMGNEK